MSKTLSHKIEELIQFCRGRKEVTLKELLAEMGSSGPAFLTLIFSVPFVLFVAIPGLSMIFGLIILITGFRLALHYSFWIPSFLRKKQISGNRMAHLMVKMVRFLKKVEKYVKPRGTIYQQGPFLLAFNGYILALSGFFLFLPLPPGMNFLPGLAVFLLSLGILEEDLAMMMGSYIAFFLNLCVLIIPFFLIH